MHFVPVGQSNFLFLCLYVTLDYKLTEEARRIDWPKKVDKKSFKGDMKLFINIHDNSVRK